jgi:SNF2 family DNA or RNA helicase
MLELSADLRDVQVSAQFGVRLKIGPRLLRWAIAEKNRFAASKEMAKASDAHLPIISKKFPIVDRAMSTRTYQRSGAAFMAGLRCAGNLDEVGLGKTLTALAAIVEAGKWRGSHLIIANKSSADAVWREEIEHWFSDDADNIGVYTMPEGKDRRQAVMDAFFESDKPTAFLIINKEMVRILYDQWCPKCECWLDQMDSEVSIKHFEDDHKKKRAIRKCDWPGLFSQEWDSVIIDEAHKVVSTGLKSATRMSQMAAGVTSLQYAPNAVRFAVTGTPFRGKEINLWGLLNWINPKAFGSKWRFAETYFNIQDNGYGKVIGSLRPEKIADLNELLDRVFLRRTRAEVRADIPSKARQNHWVRMIGEHKRQYTDFEEQGFARLDSGYVESLGVLSELTRLRQLAFGCWDMGLKGKEQVLIPTSRSPKLDLLVQMLEERGVTASKDDQFRLEGGYKYVIASQFTQIVDLVERHLGSIGIPTLKITGAVTGKKRLEVIQSFQKDPDGPRVLVMNILAGGESITLDRYCDEMFILDETWVVDDQEQLEGRIDNRSQDRLKQRTFHYIRTRETVEEGIMHLNASQDEIQKMLLDRRRGVSVAKEMLRRIG